MGTNQSNQSEDIEQGASSGELPDREDDDALRERAIREISYLKQELESQREEILEKVTHLEQLQKKSNSQTANLVENSTGAAIGRRWVGMLTDTLCRRCQEEATPQQLGTHLIIALRELILECPTGT